MKYVLALILSLPCVVEAQWRPVRVSTGTDVRAIEENFRRASLFSNRKLDKFSDETIYGDLTVVGASITFSGGGAISGPNYVQASSMSMTNLYVNSNPVSGYGVVISTPLYFSGGGIAWTDLRTPLITTSGGTVRPAALKAFRNDGGSSEGTYANAFENESVAANEDELFFSLQMPHGWKQGTAISPHLHYSVATASVPTTSDTVIFGLEYSCHSASGLFPTTSVTHSTGTVPSPYYVGYLDFSDITPASELSAICMFRLFRNSSSATDNFNADVFGLEMDFHYQIESLGSRQERAY